MKNKGGERRGGKREGREGGWGGGKYDTIRYDMKEG
jgi:hypothetical protein